MGSEWKNLCRETVKQHPQFSKLAAFRELQNISLIEYAHDPIPKAPQYLVYVVHSFPQHCIALGHPSRSYAIKLQPRESRLPFRCGLNATYESRFWRSGLESSTDILQLLAADRSATDFVVGNGITMATLAKKELQPGMEHRFCKASTYMYPFCNEERTKLLAASMVMMFLFDDKGENTTDSTLKPFIEDFVNRLDNDASQKPSDSELQRHINSVIRGFRRADSGAENGGHEVIEAMSKSFRRMRPAKVFENLREYLDFRHDNVGADYVLAAVKFSIRSSVALTDPQLKTYLMLVKDHLAIVNDMASFDKEQRAFDAGSGEDMINIVDVIRRLFTLSDIDSAKAFAYTYQLQTEEWMSEELQRLEAVDDLDKEQWRYLEATFVCAAGNAFFSMTSSRYGGEVARIDLTREDAGVLLKARKRQADNDDNKANKKRLTKPKNC